MEQKPQTFKNAYLLQENTIHFQTPQILNQERLQKTLHQQEPGEIINAMQKGKQMHPEYSY